MASGLCARGWRAETPPYGWVFKFSKLFVTKGLSPTRIANPQHVGVRSGTGQEKRYRVLSMFCGCRMTESMIRLKTSS